MAISWGATVSIGSSSATGTARSFAHTVDASTEVLLLSIHHEAGTTITVAPAWEPTGGGSETLSLVAQSTPSGSNNDVTCWLYRLDSPTIDSGNVTFTHDSNDNYGAVAWNSLVGLTINKLAEDVNDAASNTSVFSSAGAAGATAIGLGTFKGGDGDTVSDDATFDTYLANTASGANANSDIAFFVAPKIGGLPTAVTFTWNASDENAAQYFEFIESAGGISIPVVMHHLRQQNGSY